MRRDDTKSLSQRRHGCHVRPGTGQQASDSPCQAYTVLQVGGALFPFIVGSAAQKYSTKVLQPFMIAAFGVMIGIWAFVPRVDKRRA